jgi:alpha-D-xyloside xylohydrolase
MGQYQDGILDRMGCTLELGHRNSQASVPFYVSNKGYGFLWNNPAVGRATFAKNGTEWIAESSKAFDYWVTAGDTPAQIEEAYASVTGTVPMMPEYGMGFWQCKLRYRTQEELLEVAREYKRRGIPLDVIVSDFFHWPYQGDWRFDPEEWPDPEAMVKELQDMGVELMVSVWPYVDVKSENFKEMNELGLLAQTERGMNYTMDFCGNTIPFDATNPEARKYVWGKIKQNYYDKGIKIFWLDEAEPEYKKYDYDNLRYSTGSVLQTGNIYPAVYAKTFYDGMTSEGQGYVLNLLGCAWAGSQGYGALVWSGDIDTTFTSLREQFASGLNMAMSEYRGGRPIKEALMAESRVTPITESCLYGGFSSVRSARYSDCTVTAKTESPRLIPQRLTRGGLTRFGATAMRRMTFSQVIFSCASACARISEALWRARMKKDRPLCAPCFMISRRTPPRGTWRISLCSVRT